VVGESFMARDLVRGGSFPMKGEVAIAPLVGIEGPLGRTPNRWNKRDQEQR